MSPEKKYEKVIKLVQEGSSASAAYKAVKMPAWQYYRYKKAETKRQPEVSFTTLPEKKQRIARKASRSNCVLFIGSVEQCLEVAKQMN